MNCTFCEEANSSNDLLIKDYTFWRVELSKKQHYLGRCKIILKNHKEDMFDILPEEAKELFTITKQVRDTIKNVFRADLLNYASFGNNTIHVHLHIIPRYKNSVLFENITFVDKNWGKNYSPYNNNFSIYQQVLFAIRDEIKNNL